MKTELSLLNDLRIASPCKADWNAMPGTAQVRHCDDCNRKVYNFAEMTATEATALVIQEEGEVCARLYRRADGTLLTSDCPKGLAARTWSLVACTAMAAITLLFGWLITVGRAANKSEDTVHSSMGKIGCPVDSRHEPLQRIQNEP